MGLPDIMPQVQSFVISMFFNEAYKELFFLLKHDLDVGIYVKINVP